MHTLEIATCSHTGGRDEQQDSVGKWTSDQASLIVVADGVGGNVGGAAASQAVIRCAADHWHATAGHFASPEADLTTIARQAHDAITALNPGERRSPASTMVALYITPDQAHWVHCGDSRLYWLRNGRELTHTRDHSVVQLLLEDGKISPGEVNSHPDKGRILKTLGASSFKGVDYGSCDYQTGDAFALCSDGYWESINPEAKVLPPKAANMALDVYAAMLVKQAVENNGPDSDNTSLAIVFAKPDKPNRSSQSSGTTTPGTRKNGSTLKTILTIIFYTFILLDIILIFYFIFS